MRTTITLDPDVATAVARVQADRHVGVSQAVNDLVRQGLARRSATPHFTQETSAMGAPALPLDDIAAVVETLEGDASA
jgi:hypothetical protein